MFRLISHLKFLFSATNQHGVHSPFVYNYVTKCLYKKDTLKLPVILKVLVKSICYFNYNTILLLENYKSSEENIIQHCPNVSIVKNNADLVIGNVSDLQSSHLKVNELSNNCMLLLDGIHEKPLNNKSWELIKELEHVRVTIDLFYCGVIFFRKEQVKEHFKIRI